MTNTTVNMNLTPEEVIIIQNIRDMASQNNLNQKLLESLGDLTSQLQDNEKYMQKYMDMDDDEFIDEYAAMVGDDTILAVLQDTLTSQEKWDAIWSAIDEDVIDELFESYVSTDARRELFLDTQDREELCVQLVDLTMGGN